MKFIKKVIILSDGSTLFCHEFFVDNNSEEQVKFYLEDEKNFFFNKKEKKRHFDLKYTLDYKKKFF